MRSANHTLVELACEPLATQPSTTATAGAGAGAAEERADCGLRGLIFQCLFQGARANLSEYDLPPIPPIELVESEGAVRVAVWRYDSSDGALLSPCRDCG